MEGRGTKNMREVIGCQMHASIGLKEAQGVVVSPCIDRYQNAERGINAVQVTATLRMLVKTTSMRATLQHDRLEGR